jgi:hypothetical protein
MTIRSNYNSQTLDEYLQSVKRRVETGNSPPSGIFLELCHFARLYRHAADHPEPAEPGASRNQLPLSLIDEIRAEVATIKDNSIKAALLAKLEQLSIHSK